MMRYLRKPFMRLTIVPRYTRSRNPIGCTSGCSDKIYETCSLEPMMQFTDGIWGVELALAP